MIWIKQEVKAKTILLGLYVVPGIKVPSWVFFFFTREIFPFLMPILKIVSLVFLLETTFELQ